MLLIDVDNHKGYELSKQAEAYVLSKWPPGEFNEMYDLDGDVCLDESDYDYFGWLLAQEDFDCIGLKIKNHAGSDLIKI